MDSICYRCYRLTPPFMYSTSSPAGSSIGDFIVNSASPLDRRVVECSDLYALSERAWSLCFCFGLTCPIAAHPCIWCPNWVLYILPKLSSTPRLPDLGWYLSWILTWLPPKEGGIEPLGRSKSGLPPLATNKIWRVRLRWS